MDIIDEQTIWFPGFYDGRQSDEYTQAVRDAPLEMVVELVQKRAQEDGQWLIDNDRVGPHGESKTKMLRMMAFVTNPKNIKQCINHIYEEGMEGERSVDWVCRELADASKFMVR